MSLLESKSFSNQDVQRNQPQSNRYSERNESTSSSSDTETDTEEKESTEQIRGFLLKKEEEDEEWVLRFFVLENEWLNFFDQENELEVCL